MYRVVKFFTDLQDGDHPYHVGEAFPRDGVEVTEERIKELSGRENRQGVPLIEYAGEQDSEQETESPVDECENGADESGDSTESAEPEKKPVKKKSSQNGRKKVSGKA